MRSDEAARESFRLVGKNNRKSHSTNFVSFFIRLKWLDFCYSTPADAAKKSKKDYLCRSQNEKSAFSKWRQRERKWNEIMPKTISLSMWKQQRVCKTLKLITNKEILQITTGSENLFLLFKNTQIIWIFFQLLFIIEWEIARETNNHNEKDRQKREREWGS